MNRSWNRFSAAVSVGLAIVVAAFALITGLPSYIEGLVRTGRISRYWSTGDERRSSFSIETDSAVLEYHGAGTRLWLQNHIIDDSIVAVDLSDSDVSDDDLQCLAAAQLRDIALDRTCVTDKGLYALKNQRALVSLYLADCRVTNKGVAPLLHFNPIGVLDLSGTEVDGELLKHVRFSERLVFLEFARTRLTDRGVESLSGMKNLRRVNVAHTRVTDETARILGKMSWLSSVDVSGTRVTTSGVAAIRSIPGLVELEAKQ